MPDVGNRRRQPKGTPEGGRFAREHHGADADDLTPRPLFDPKHPDDSTIRALRHASGSTLAQAIALDEPRVDWALSYNPHCDWDTLLMLYDRQPDETMRRHVFNGMCMNPVSEEHHMKMLDGIKRLHAADRRMAWTCMARNPRLDPKAGARIATGLGTTRAYIPVAEALAGNPRLADETLAQLVLKFPENTWLLHCVISNPAAGDNALIAAASRSRDGFDVKEAWSRVTSPAWHARADLSNPWVRRGLEANPACTPETLSHAG